MSGAVGDVSTCANCGRSIVLRNLTRWGTEVWGHAHLQGDVLCNPANEDDPRWAEPPMDGVVA